MTARRGPDWDELGQVYPRVLVEALRAAFERGSVSFTPIELANASEVGDAGSPSVAQAEALLRAAEPWLEARRNWNCPHCGYLADRSALDAEVCRGCDRRFDEADDWDPNGAEIERWIYHGPRDRDVHWILVLHGMNTTGAWQERFNWLVARTYGRSVPVAIYKYGKVRPGAVIPWLQRRHRDRLADQIRRFAFEVEEAGLRTRPDVIAHSFGTWLLGHALARHRDLEVGRVILTGCILKPGFNWGALENRGQVEAVLNHYGDRDGWARISRWAIPDSGPSGYRGVEFDPEQWREGRRTQQDRVLFNIREPGFRHSDFFSVDARSVKERRADPRPELDQLGRVFETVWQPFLVNPLGVFRARGDLS